MARQQTPDLIISDIIMPNMDGVQLCHELRRDPKLSAVPILLLTAKGRIEDKLDGLEAGADDYLTKPFDIRELQLRVKMILKRTLEPDSLPEREQFNVGQLSLNCDNFKLTTQEKQVLLSPTEFDLLYHLMSHPGEVFSSEALLQEVWGYTADTGSPDLVRMHVRNLRIKIEPDSRKPRYVLTVPSRGYTIALDEED
jgi:DNA-binding response OmpR family regulator